MKGISELSVAQVRIYPADSLPFAYLRLEANLKAVKEEFQFEKVKSDEAEVVFQNGVFESDGTSTLVSGISVEERKIIIKVHGDSSAGDAVCALLMKLLRAFDRRRNPSDYQPVLVTQETACVASLDIGFSELISQQLVEFLQAYVREKLCTEFATPISIDLRQLRFGVRYEPKDPSLGEQGVTLSNKDLTIEPRAGTTRRERRFFTSSPTDSRTHLRILEALEKELSATRPRKRNQPRKKPR